MSVEGAECVLDASAMLVALHGEPGEETVRAVLGRSIISSVNWSEVVQKSLARDAGVDGMRADLQALGLRVVPFTAEEAEVAAALWPKTRSHGLALGDRACLALGLRTGLPVLTTDKVWRNLRVGVTIRLVR